MTKLFVSNIIRTKEAKMLIVMACFILILPVVNLFNSDFMKISGTAQSISFLDFLAGEFSVQNMLMLPMVVMAYLVASTIYMPFATGRMFLYKDMSRTAIINAKILALMSIYALYALVQTVITFGVYYLYIVRLAYASGTLLPQSMSDASADIVSIISILFTHILTILIAGMLATLYSTGIIMFGSIAWLCLCATLPHLSAARYAVPSGYVSLLPALGLPTTIVLMTALSTAYATALYLCTRHRFARIEY
ncbi:hypothetical protein JS530_08755 [Bifidobacterium sp. LC6]|uniref:ABC-2 family transporter protein n=1 Tax=Bifidobacterium colobi TaxID=2809026 RepID=A0ABS5UXQ5_9BIFI|nr:hypothetical protein [Bifidobacterium colobi]MBT1175583.1 hypothetical protein [Bifidobacterium colobi]